MRDTMKRYTLISFLTLGLLLSGCGAISQEDAQASVTSWAVVRNVRWGMTKDEVIKAENLDKDIKEGGEDRLSWIQNTTELAGKEAIIGYVFLNNSLERVYYIVDKNAWFWEYWYLRRALGKKYGGNDISQEECSETPSQLKEIQEKNLDNKEKLKELESLQSKLRSCLWDQDIQYFADSVKWTNIDDMRSTYLSLGDIGYYHNRKNNETNIDLILSSGLFGIDEVILSLEYTSDNLKKYEKEQEQQKLSNSI